MSWGSDAAYGGAKPRSKRAWSDPSLPWQGNIHDPVYRSNTTINRSLSRSVDALRIEPCDFEVAFIHDVVCRLPRTRLLGRW